MVNASKNQRRRRGGVGGFIELASFAANGVLHCNAAILGDAKQCDKK
jgi:hypothetical protein